jgi:serine/threonine protein kinase
MRPEVTALFREVADLPAAERGDYYARRQVPEALRAEVESLLQYDVAGDSLRGYVASAERDLIDSPSTPQAESPRRGRGVPDTIGRFTVTKLLGRGGMGEVYLARDPLIDRLVAIKLIGGEREGDAERRRLVREARAAGRLHHPNIVTVFEAGEHEGRSFIAMEYVPGETVGSLIGRRAPLSLRRRLEMIEGACAGLAHAHREGVIHLDIKPDNLMLADTGIVKVLDFGISRVLQNETLATMHGAGTLRYMSPEQIQGKPLDHRSDVFSLGCSLFELVSYAPAFIGSTKEIVTQISSGPVPSLLDVSPNIDRRLDDTLGRAMALDPSERYADLEEMRAELAEIRAGIDPAEDEPLSASPLGVVASGAEGAVAPSSRRSSSRRRTRWRSRSAMAAGIGAAVLAGIGAFAAWGARSAPESGSVSPPPVATTAVSPEAERAPAVERAPIVESGDEVWRQLARGDRAAVLARLGTAGRAATDPALASAVVETVRTTVLRTREQAAASGSAAGAETYRAGENQLARANRLAAGGQPVESLRALWQAADLYSRSLATPGSPVTVLAEPRPAATSDLTIASSGVPQLGPEAVEGVRPPPATAAPVTSSRTEPPLAAMPAPTRRAPSDSEAILDTLRRYDASYESLDVAALLKVFPSLGNDQVEQLRRTFAGMATYEIDSSISRVTVANNGATVLARVARRMTPRVGRAVVSDVEMEFRLQRAGADWVIVSVSVR